MTSLEKKLAAIVDELETTDDLALQEELVDSYWDMRSANRNDDPRSLLDLDNRVRVCLYAMSPPNAELLGLYEKQRQFACHRQPTDAQWAQQNAVCKQVDIYHNNHRAFGRWGVKHRETP